MTRPPVVWHPEYEIDIGPHVFPTAKYRLVLDRLMGEGTVSPDQIVQPDRVTDDEIRLVHTSAYADRIATGSLTPREQQVLEVPFTPALREAMGRSCGGTLLASRLALEHGAAVHIGGGFHHAFPDHGEGFCLLNDVAIAIRILHRDGRVERVVVVDLDVHHGNGTAAIFDGDDRVFTLSFHQEHNYPAIKPPGDLDVALPDGIDDDEYLAHLNRHLPDVLDRHRPDLAVYLAGADPYRMDQLGGLGLSIGGLQRRDDYVFEALAERGVPVAVTLAGGYAVDTDDTVKIHCDTVRALIRRMAR